MRLQCSTMARAQILVRAARRVGTLRALGDVVDKDGRGRMGSTNRGCTRIDADRFDEPRMQTDGVDEPRMQAD